MVRYVHGLRHHPLYKTWIGMKERCTKKYHKYYDKYGGRGITVCDEWMNSFPAFLRDMGEKPDPNHSLDRIDNSRGYSPDNCRWADRLTQQQNRDNTRWITINNERKTLMELSEEYGVSYKTLQTRWWRGIRDESILKPGKRGRPKKT